MQNGDTKKLIRFKDNTFCWTHGADIFSDIMSLANAIAYGTWHLKINKNEIEKAIVLLGSSKTHHKMALFSHLNDFLYVDTIQMEEANEEEVR